jgi:hypothetical protein
MNASPVSALNVIVPAGVTSVCAALQTSGIA